MQSYPGTPEKRANESSPRQVSLASRGDIIKEQFGVHIQSHHSHCKSAFPIVLSFSRTVDSGYSILSVALFRANTLVPHLRFAPPLVPPSPPRLDLRYACALQEAMSNQEKKSNQPDIADPSFVQLYTRFQAGCRNQHAPGVSPSCETMRSPGAIADLHTDANYTSFRVLGVPRSDDGLISHRIRLTSPTLV
jgi:hypothetical protein